MLLVIATVLTLATLSLGLPYHSAQLKQMFESYKVEYKRAYSSGKEERKRFMCFVENLHLIEERNKADTATHGVNDFTDICPAEFREKYLNYIPLSQPRRGMNITTIHLPEVTNSLRAIPAFDWRSYGVVAPIQNQGNCGSCWAFSAVAAMEGAWNKQYKPSPFLKLSEGYLTQCSNGVTPGCQGGNMLTAINYVAANGGIPSLAAYPYTSGGGVSGTCSKTPSYLVKSATFWGAAVFATKLESAIAAALPIYSPFYIAVDATQYQTYKSGIVSLCTFTSLNHGVNLVGIGISGSSNYWTIRNSWGTSWGEQGYIRVAYGSNCNGLTTMVGTAVVYK